LFRRGGQHITGGEEGVPGPPPPAAKRGAMHGGGGGGGGGDGVPSMRGGMSVGGEGGSGPPALEYMKMIHTMETYLNDSDRERKRVLM